MKRLKRLGAELAKSGVKSLIRKAAPVPLCGMTLEEDDAAIAREWINKQDRWEDSTVIATLESAFANWSGSRHAIAFSAGRKALSASIEAFGFAGEDEVIVPGYTCIVVQNAFDFASVRTVHCDIELDTFGPDVASVAACITPRTRAILLQHLYGLVCRDYEAILQLARRSGIKVIEDCAHVTGARFRGKRVGTFGDVAFYSAEWSKIFTSIGGGIAVTDDDVIAAGLRSFASKCVHPEPGTVMTQLRTAILTFLAHKRSSAWWALPWARFKYGRDETIGMSQLEIAGGKPDDYFTRMPAPAAALALNQLGKIDTLNSLRRETAAGWGAWCDQHGYRKPLTIPDSEPSFLRYPVMVEPARKANPDWASRDLGVSLGVWFRTHLHPSSKPVTNCPNADKAVAQCVNFPCLLPSQFNRSGPIRPRKVEVA